MSTSVRICGLRQAHAVDCQSELGQGAIKAGADDGCSSIPAELVGAAASERPRAHYRSGIHDDSHARAFALHDALLEAGLPKLAECFAADRDRAGWALGFILDGEQGYLLAQLAEEYHGRTEAYDRRACTGLIGRDGIMPAAAHERALINRNAAEIRREQLARAGSMGFTPAAFLRAIAAYCLVPMKEYQPLGARCDRCLFDLPAT
jgi:hypothetical protein